MYYLFFLLVFSVQQCNSLEMVFNCNCFQQVVDSSRLKDEIKKELSQKDRLTVGKTLVRGNVDRWWEKYEQQERDLYRSLNYKVSYFNQYHQYLLMLNSLISLTHSYCIEKLNREYFYYKDIKRENEWYQLLHKEYRNTSDANQIYQKYYSKLLNDFKNAKHKCLSKHISLNTFCDSGILELAIGNYEKAVENAYELIEIAKKNDKLKELNVENYINLGIACIEGLEYIRAIEMLSLAIEKDPTNKEAFFNRAVAYFESGNFDLAMNDYLSSSSVSIKTEPIASSSFAASLLTGLAKGSYESASEILPSLLYTMHGINESLWVSAQHPVEKLNNFIDLCYELGNSFVQFCNELDWNKIENYSMEVRQLCDNYQRLEDHQKGEQIGYLIGKYGINTFMPLGAIKCYSSFKKLQNANRICNFESMTIAKSSREVIISNSNKHFVERETYFQNVKYDFNGSHTKHIPDHVNYNSKKSIWQHPNPEGLLRKFAGTGYPVRGKPGSLDYKEVVDFGEVIGIWKNAEGTLSSSTTRGTIHYGKNGAHIVPSKPKHLLD